MPWRFIVGATSVLLLYPVLGSAQERTVELGLDAAIDYKVNNPNATLIGLPVQALRVGYEVAERLTVEPRVSFNYIKFESTDAAWTLSLGGGVLYHFNDVRRGAYIRPFADWSHIDVGSGSASQFAAGGGLGYKMGTGKLRGRVEAAYSHAFENDDFFASDDVILLFGFSFFTK